MLTAAGLPMAARMSRVLLDRRSGSVPSVDLPATRLRDGLVGRVHLTEIVTAYVSRDRVH